MDNLQQQDRPFLFSHPGPVAVTLDIDADVLTWLQEKSFWRGEVKDLLRFYMETHLIREAAFEEAAAGDNKEVAEMDGHQQGERPNFSSTFQPASILDHPGVTKPAGGVARAMTFAKGMSRKAFILMGVVAFFQYVMPDDFKPSNIIGGFHGATETAELRAKKEMAAEYERKLADAKAAPPANYQMEIYLSQKQQEIIAQSLATQETTANLADAACFASMLVTPLMGDTKDARDLRDGMQGGCAAADAIRANMAQTLARAARQGSGVVPRSTPETGAGSAQPIPSATRSR